MRARWSLPLTASLVWLVRVPLGPDDIAAVTAMPDCAVGFPFSSMVCSTGCVANAVPLGVGDDGWIEILSRPAAPARAVAVNRTGRTGEASIRAVRVY